MKWKLLNRRSGYDGFFKIDICQVQHELYSGGDITIKRELFHRGDAVAVLLYDPANDKLVMVEQFRVGALEEEQGPWLLEVVAGIVEPGESVKQVAQRECHEEAGLDVHAFESVHAFYPSPGGCSEKVYLLCGLVDSGKAAGIHGIADEGEDIRVVVLDYNEVETLLATGRVTSAIAIIALQWLQIHRERLRIESFVM